MRARGKTAGLLTSLILVGLVQFTAARAASEVGNYLVMFKEQPAPDRIAHITDINDRRRALHEMAIDLASKTQGGALAVLQAEQRVGRVEELRSLYLVNAIAFRGQKAVADSIALRPEVRSVSVDEIVKAPSEPGIDNAQWHLDQIHAREAWNLGFSGAGVVVGSIDTGVDVGHPGIISKYRGLGPSGLNHDFNWFDSSSFSSSPFDNNGHGTHTMGGLVGGNGPAPDDLTTGPDTGVAYGAKWIAAKAFDSEGKGLTSGVLLAMQWMQFPTDSRGNIRPDLAPDVVNNSWGADGGCRGWYSVALKMWRAARILPVFSVGDGGSNPASPGDLVDALSVGATNAGDNRAGFSNQGSSQCDTTGIVKPDIHAPGVNITSSVPGARYASKTGTSMAAPQVAGAAALMMEASGRGLPVEDRTLDSEMMASGDQCVSGNSFDCRRLNVFKAVRRVQRTGVLRGTVTNTSGLPLQGAKISVIRSDDSVAISATTDVLGSYAIHNLSGTYGVTATAYGYVTEVTATSVPANQTTVLDFQMESAPLRRVEGHVTYSISGEPAVSATVQFLDTPLVTTTALDGSFVFPEVPDPSVPDSSDPDVYDYVIVVRGDPCSRPASRLVAISDSGGNVFDFELPLKRDDYGYSCHHIPMIWVPGTTPLDLKGDDVSARVTLPFAFPFYDQRDESSSASDSTASFISAFVSDNGVVRFDVGGNEYFNVPPPHPSPPNAAIYAFWDDLRMDEFSEVLTSSTADTFTIEWRDMLFHPPAEGRITFSATLHRNGDVELRYLSASGPEASGSSATIGLENREGSIGFVYSHNEGVIRNGLDIVFSPAAQPGDLKGSIFGGGGERLAGATVSFIDSNNVSRTTISDATGEYRLRVQAGSYTSKATAFGYATSTQSISVPQGTATVVNFTLTRLTGFRVTGTVSDLVSGTAIPDVPVSLGNSNIADVRTDSNGIFVFNDVPPGQYVLSTKGSGRCRPNVTRTLNVEADTQVSLQMTRVTDDYGYRCEDFAAATWVSGDTALALSGDSGWIDVDLAFPFPLYGENVTKAYVAIDGYVGFVTGTSEPGNTLIPSMQPPNLALYPFWDDLFVQSDSKIYTRSGSNFLVVEWRSVATKSDPAARLTFEVIIFASGNFQFQYKDVTQFTDATGSSATIGWENTEGTIAFQYSANKLAVSSNLRIAVLNPSSQSGEIGDTGVIGKVTDETSGVPLQSVDIVVNTSQGTKQAITDPEGRYGFALSPGTYTLFASKSGYFAKQVPVSVPTTGFATVDFTMSKLPQHTLSGLVRDQSLQPLGRFDFKIVGSAGEIYTMRSDNSGGFVITLDQGTYTFVVEGSGRCQQPMTTQVVLDRNLSDYSLVVTLRRDSFGYACVERPLGRLQGVLLAGAAGKAVPIPLPFEFPIYAERARVAYPSELGTVTFDRGGLLDGPVGSTVKVFNDPDLQMDGSSLLLAIMPNPDTVVIEWRDMLLQGERVTFEVILYKTGDIEMHYLNGTSDRESGSNAVIGLFDYCGDRQFVYADHEVGAVGPNHSMGFAKRFAELGNVSC